MTNTFSEQLLERRLSLSDLVQDLKADGHLTDEDLIRIGLSSKVKVHPLVFWQIKTCPMRRPLAPI